MAQPPSVVLDANVWLKVFVLESDSLAAERLVMSEPSYVVPDLLFAEYANVIWAKRRAQELTDQAAEHAMSGLQAMRGSMTVVSSAELAAEALKIALDLDHPVYDCFYLALAERADVPLVTADSQLYRAVRRRDRGRKVRLLA